MEKMNERFGLPMVIHRPSSITGEHSGRFDLMSNIFKYVELLESGTAGSSLEGLL